MIVRQEEVGNEPKGYVIVESLERILRQALNKMVESTMKDMERQTLGHARSKKTA